MAPTVSLCAQQFAVITSQISSVQAKLLTGDDGVDSWSTQEIWTAFLFNVRIVVSTYQVLLDALYHGFIRMSALGLIVLDEGGYSTILVSFFC